MTHTHTRSAPVWLRVHQHRASHTDDFNLQNLFSERPLADQLHVINFISLILVCVTPKRWSLPPPLLSFPHPT